MKSEILTHLNEPRQLERLYRTNKSAFKREFRALYPELEGKLIADIWNERLHYQDDDINWGTSSDLLLVIVASLFAGIVAKLPAILSISGDYFYPRNIGFIIFAPLAAYFIWKNKLSRGKVVAVVVAALVGLIFINVFPDDQTSDTLILSCIHLILFLWLILGFVFVGKPDFDAEKRLGYLRFNGDLLVITALLLITGGIMTGITIGLFSLIGYNIEEFYFEYVGVFGLAAIPIVGTYLIRSNPPLVDKISAVIAKIFSPLVLGMLVIYLIAIIYSGKDPYNDRDFLLIFNALLVGVMAIIFFSLAEIPKTARSRVEVWVVFLLAVITIVVNGIALSAILFRILEYGITPNRAAVLGSNGLILINLGLVARQLFRVLFRKAELSGVGKTIARYLPVYFVWAIIVTFVFPLLFGFR